jgi:competence protein ComEC
MTAWLLVSGYETGIVLGALWMVATAGAILRSGAVMAVVFWGGLGMICGTVQAVSRGSQVESVASGEPVPHHGWVVVEEQIRCRPDRCSAVVRLEDRGILAVSSLKGVHRLLPGDLFLIKGRLVTIQGPMNPGEFDARRHYLSSGVARRLVVSSWMACESHREADVSRSVERLRFRLVRGLASSGLTGDALGIARALTLGALIPLEPQVRVPFSNSGTAHLLAVSGLHLACVGGALYHLLYWFLRRVPSPASAWGRRVSLLGMMAGSGFYLLLSGTPVSCIRAFVMLGGYAVCGWLHRSYDLRTWLSVSAMVLMASDTAMMENLGFQLSTVSVAAIAWGMTGSEERTSRGWRRWLHRVGGLLRVSLCAFGATLPLTWWHFHTVPVVAPLANLTAVPLGSFVVLPLAMLSCILSQCWPWGAWASSTLLSWAVEFLLWTNQMWLRAGPALRLAWPGMWIATLPGLLILAGSRAGGRLRALCLGCAGLVLLATAGWQVKGGAHQLAVLHVGDGDCAVASTPCGDHVLFDGGRPGSGQVALRGTFGRLGLWRFRRLYISHGHNDHYGGIEEIAADLHICEIVTGGSPAAVEAARRIADAATGCDGAPVVRIASAGDRWTICGLAVEALWPSSSVVNELSGENDRSLVTRLGWDGAQWIGTGDIEGKSLHARESLLAESWMAHSWWPDREGPRRRFLKAPHHGHASPLLAHLVRATAADVVVIPSSGKLVDWSALGCPEGGDCLEKNLLLTATQGILTFMMGSKDDLEFPSWNHSKPESNKIRHFR